VISKFEIKINSITSDNAPNMINAIKCYPENEYDLFPIKLIRCAAHIINLIVQICFRDSVLNEANGKIRYFCKRVHGSSVLSQFMADQFSFTKEPNIKVEVDISVRWNSTHDMLQSALRVSRALTALSIH
jgi:hypothetical protein